jgi:hypothetical protein
MMAIVMSPRNEIALTRKNTINARQLPRELDQPALKPVDAVCVLENSSKTNRRLNPSARLDCHNDDEEQV